MQRNEETLSIYIYIYKYIYIERERDALHIITHVYWSIIQVTIYHLRYMTHNWILLPSKFGSTQILCSTVQNRLSQEGHWETFHNLKVNMNNSLTSSWKRHMKALESLSHLREYDSYHMCYWVHLYISANDLSPTNYQIYQPSLPTSWGSILINKLELNSICL